MGRHSHRWTFKSELPTKFDKKISETEAGPKLPRFTLTQALKDDQLADVPANPGCRSVRYQSVKGTKNRQESLCRPLNLGNGGARLVNYVITGVIIKGYRVPGTGCSFSARPAWRAPDYYIASPPGPGPRSVRVLIMRRRMFAAYA